MEHTCRNCGAAFNGKFCNTCGQKFDVPRFTFKHIFEEGFHALTHADKSFLSFAKDVVLYPGRVAYEYIVERRRKKYFNPFTFFLLIAAISLFIDSAKLKLEDRLFHQNNEYGHLLNVYGKALLFVLIPVIALGLRLLPARKPRLLFTEYTVFAMIVMSSFTILDSITKILSYVYTILTHDIISFDNNIIYPFIAVVYLAYADYGFHKRLGSPSIPRSGVAGFLILFLIVLVQLGMIWGIINGYEGIGTFQTFGLTFRW
ncbi:MAG: DUF3667 domain-containing protein [Chitinophagaceae bacterium]|nr:MAG: DUF3667 domain-containing protein [Chitinophagaceae bacterium]